VYVTLAQAMWLTALKHCSPTTISVGTTSLFVLTLVWVFPWRPIPLLCNGGTSRLCERVRC